MKIAIITDDGKRVNAHFGRATHVLVVTAEDGKEVAREMRDKPFHGSHDHDHDHNHDHNHVHVHDEHDHDHHHGQGGFFQQVLAVVSDCNVLIARGMGQSAFNKLQQAGIQPILTDNGDLETAVSAVLANELAHNPVRVHSH